MSFFKRQDPTKLQEQVAALKGSSGFAKDEKEWKLTLDAQKNGSAVIRFLPNRSDDELAFIRLVNHSFKKNNNWYIENCPSTHGDYDGCPICQYISDNDLFEKSKAHGKGSEADKTLGMIGRKQSFWANILVIKDPGAPENEGKVFKFRFGKKIMDKITATIAGNPDLDEAGIAVTCPFGGANFTLKAKKVGDWPNYDDSVFGVPGPIKGIDDEAVQKAIFEGMSDLRPITAPDQFKPTAELTAKFTKVFGGGAALGAGASAGGDLDAELEGFDAQLKNFDNTKGAKESGGVNQLNVGGAVPEDDDTPPFDVGGTGDDDLDKLLEL